MKINLIVSTIKKIDDKLSVLNLTDNEIWYKLLSFIFNFKKININLDQISNIKKTNNKILLIGNANIKKKLNMEVELINFKGK